MKKIMSGVGWARRAQQILPIFLLTLTFCATASGQNEAQTVGPGVPNLPPCTAENVGWTHCAQQNELQQAQQFLKAGQAEQAGLIFERILLEQPWRLGVWLDYAQSLQLMGDNDSARAIYQSILRQSPPEHLVSWLKQQIKITSPFIPGWQYAGAITLMGGHDSNLNRAPTASNLTLTLPSGTLLVLPLTDASRASAGASHLLRFDWQAAHQSAANGEWLLQATLNSRFAPDIGGQDYLQSSLGVSHNWIGASAREYRAIFAAQNLQYSGENIQRTLRAGLYQKRRWQTDARTGCATNYGAEWEMLTYPSIGELDGRYLGIAADLGCKQNLDWQLLLRAGVDQAEHQRPGGDQQRIELLGQLGGNFGTGKWLALAEITQLHDTDGYSPLLDNNAARNIRRGLLKLEYQRPLGSNLHAVANAEFFRQNSNLPLFTLRGEAGWLGVRYVF